LLMMWVIISIMGIFQNIWFGKPFDPWCGLQCVILFLLWQLWRRSLSQLLRNYTPNLSLLAGGANHNFPGVFWHAPNAFFGLALPWAIDDQFIGQVKKLLIHGAIPSHMGCLCNISLEQAQMEVGISTPILEASFEDYHRHLLIFCWIKILWEHLWKNSVLLCNSEQVLPNLQWEGDFFVMER
jgi:hypothetical protein